MDAKVILASASQGRLNLLKQIGITPDHIIPADIDEIRKRGENGKEMSLRLAVEKAQVVAKDGLLQTFSRVLIIAADTVPVCQGRVMRKAYTDQDVRDSLIVLSGRRHEVYTGVCMIYKSYDEIKISQKSVKTVLKFRQIPKYEIDHFVNLGEGINKAGGYTLYGYAESFVTNISGSVSNVIGLPLCQVMNFLNSNGISSAQGPHQKP